MRTGTVLSLALVCVLLALAAGHNPARPAAAAAAPRGEAAEARVPVIRVEGHGEARVTPDRARLDLAVESRAATAEGAAETNARRARAVLDALRAADLPDDAIGTRDFGVHPIHGRERPEGPPMIEGYRAYNVVSVRVDEVARVGELVDAGVRAGADRVERLRFEVSDPEGVQREALTRAVADARATAEAMAAALGVTLGPVVDAASGAMPPDSPVMRMALETDGVAARPQTPIDPEEQVVTATVRLVHAIGGPARGVRRDAGASGEDAPRPERERTAAGGDRRP